MMMRKYKMLTALMLTLVLAFTPMSLFASPWEEEGAAFKAQLVYVLGEEDAAWLAKGIIWFLDGGYLVEEALAEAFTMDIDDFLEIYLTPAQIENFWDPENEDNRLWMVFDLLLHHAWKQWSDWSQAMTANWKRDLSYIWHEDAGQAFLEEAAELVLMHRAVQIAESLDVLKYLGYLSDEEFFEMLEMGAEAALKHYLTSQELSDFLEMNYINRYWFLDDTFFAKVWDDRETIDLDNWSWEQEQLGFRAQLVHLLGEHRAMLLVGDIEWHRDFGELTDEILLEIFSLDIMAFLAEHMTREEIEEFFTLDDGEVQWGLFDMIAEAFIWPTWEQEQLGFRAQLVRLLGEDGVVQLLEFSGLIDETLHRLPDINVMDILARLLTPEEIESFLSKDYEDRFWYIWDIWDIIQEVYIWPAWDNWDWTPDLSPLWDEEGAALLAQLTEIASKISAAWIAYDLEANKEFLGEELFAEILAMDVMAFLAEHMTAEEIEEIGYLDLWDIMWEVFIRPAWEAWDWLPTLPAFWTEEEGAALLAQLVEIVGNRRAVWIALDLYWDRGILDEEVFAEILALDVMAFLGEHLTAEEIEAFLEQEYPDRYGILWDLISEVYIWDAWHDWWDWNNDWTWTPDLSPFWEEEGAALLAQLTEIVGESRAAWIAQDLYWDKEFLEEEAFAEILALDVMAFLTEHMTAEEIEAFLEQDYTDRYWDLWDIMRDVFIWPAWDAWDWDSWGWTPTFSALWEEEGAALLAQLIEIVGEHRASWVAEDLERERERLGEEVFAEILALDVMAFLAEHMTTEEIDAFLGQNYLNRYSDLWGIMQRAFIWPAWDAWDWTQNLSSLWSEEGAALLAQLVEIVGGRRAVWLTEHLELDMSFLGEEAFAEILALDIMAFLAEHMTAEEIEAFFEQNYDNRYWDLWDLINEVYIWPAWDNWDWDSNWAWRPTLMALWEEEGAALYAQLTELVGERYASWIAEDLYWDRDIIGEETFAIILDMDILAFLAAEIMLVEEFLEMDYSDRYWTLWEAINETFIWPAWDNWGGSWGSWDWPEGGLDICREDIAYTLDIVIYEFLKYDDFDFIALFAAADMTRDDFVDILYALLSIDEFAASVLWWSHNEDWLYRFIDDILHDLYREVEADAIMLLRMMPGLVTIFEILGEDSWDFLMLRTFDHMADIFGEYEFMYAMLANPYFEDILRTYSTYLLNHLNFSLYEALEAYFNDEETPYGFSILNYLVGDLLTENMDVLYELYAAGPTALPEPRPQFWSMVFDWEYIIIGHEDIEQRISFNPTEGTEFAIDFLDIAEAGANLNLFYRNLADAYAHFVIEGWGTAGEIYYAFEVAPFGAAVIQLSAEALRGGASLVWITVVNMDGGEVMGEFAFRKTRLPLGYEQ
ncbi:MAG: hypothetical protein FWC76_07140 [Defluviitaleaceae bacterium]|nr:hypothetical protein [Defluviitaleaceae bacterium]